MVDMTDTTDTPRNREAWLTDFTAMIMPYIRKRTGLSLGESSVKLSCGFPSKGGTARKNRRIGECHHIGTGGERKYHQLFIHPQLIDPLEIGGTVTHEILHAMLPSGVGHRKPFSQAAKKLGLAGKPTATHIVSEREPDATEQQIDLRDTILKITAQLGDYPHESLDASSGRVPRRPLLKYMCQECGYTVRVTQVWIDEAGAPICPQCLESMEWSEAGEGAGDSPLIALEQTIEYRVKAVRTNPFEKPHLDPRWALRMNRKGKHVEWFVMDFGPAIDPTTGHAVLGFDTHTDPETGIEVAIPRTRLTRAESRDDALALMEALREADDTDAMYKELGVDDDAPDLDVDDPFYEDEDESLDDDPFTQDELDIYEAEVTDRELGRAKVEPRPEKTPEERQRELENLWKEWEKSQ